MKRLLAIALLAACGGCASPFMASRFVQVRVTGTNCVVNVWLTTEGGAQVHTGLNLDTNMVGAAVGAAVKSSAAGKP